MFEMRLCVFVGMLLKFVLFPVFYVFTSLFAMRMSLI